MFAALRRWLDERLDWDDLIAPLRHKTVPTHRLSYWYFFGGITLFLFVIQVLTGILLLLYYRPGANEAFESVQYIMTRVQFGWLIRSIHSWSANLMIFTAFAHMFSVLFLKAYRKPRELTWVSGVLLLFLVMGFGFSGYLLPWNTLAFFATKVGTEIAGQVPIVGKPMMIFLRGGEEVTGATLTRFFGFHVAVLPGIGNRADSDPPVAGATPGHERSSETGSAVDRESVCEAGNEILPQLLAAGIDGLVRGPGSAGRVGGHLPVEPGRQGGSFCVCARRESSPSGTSSSCSRRSSSSPPKCGSSTGRFWACLLSAWSACCGFCCLFLRVTEPSRTKKWITGLAVFALAYVAGMSVYGYLAK